jgi:5'-3' exonuclease
VGLYGIGPVKAAKLLKGCEGEQELFQAVVEAYKAANEPLERVLENARLLFLLREKGQVWQPPTEK